MQRKNEFSAVRHVFRTIMTQTENICSVRCEGTFFSFVLIFVGKFV